MSAADVCRRAALRRTLPTHQGALERIASHHVPEACYSALGVAVMSNSLYAAKMFNPL